MDPILQEKIRSYQRIGNQLVASTVSDAIVILAEIYEPENEVRKPPKKKSVKKSNGLGSWRNSDPIVHTGRPIVLRENLTSSVILSPDDKPNPPEAA